MVESIQIQKTKKLLDFVYTNQKAIDEIFKSSKAACGLDLEVPIIREYEHKKKITKHEELKCLTRYKYHN